MPRQSAPPTEETVASTSAKVLGANLSELMKDHKTLNSNPTVAKKTGMSASTVHRMRHGQVDATLRTLDKLAEAFGVRPWELLVPALDLKRRPVSRPASSRVLKLLAEVAKEIEASE